MSNLLNIVIEPVKVFEHIKGKDDWWIPFIFIVILTLIFTWVTSPAVSRLIAQRMAEMGVERELPAYLDIIKYVTIPVSVIISWLVMSLVIWMLSNSLGADWDYIKALDIFAYASVIGILKSILGTIILLIRGMENIMTFRDLQLATGLDLIFNPENPRLYALVSNIEIFQIWAYVLIVYGISEITGISRKKAIIVALITFIIGLGFKVLFAGRGGM